MADTFVIDPSPNRSTIRATVVPETDGIFLFTVEPKADANGHGTPAIWAEIFIDGRSDKKSGEITWEDGTNWFKLTTAEHLQAGKDYEITAISGNRNAVATGINIDIRRANA